MKYSKVLLMLWLLGAVSCATRPAKIIPPETEPQQQAETESGPEITVKKSQPVILLSFDDNYFNVWKQYFDLFDKYDAKVTFFVQGKFNQFCTDARNRGHDIGYHTVNHLNLIKVSRNVFYIETVSQAETFRNNGIPLVSFAYPFGQCEPWMHTELLKHYKIVRTYGAAVTFYSPADFQKGIIRSTAIDTIVYKNDADYISAIDAMLDNLKLLGPGHILPLTTHTISDTADWGIKPQRLEYLLKTAQDLQLSFCRYDDF